VALNLFRALMPAEEAFTPLFCEQSDLILRAATELQQMTARGTPPGEHVATIRAIEVSADAVAKKVFVAANRTFNAPIDREDILQLGHLLDDCVDIIEDTAKSIERYAIHEFPPDLRAIADAVVEAAGVLREVMPFLDSIGKDYKQIAALCQQIGEIEGRADESFDRGVTHLRAQLRSGEVDTIRYIDLKEVYELIEDVVDGCDDVANAVQSITAKHV